MSQKPLTTTAHYYLMWFTSAIFPLQKYFFPQIFPQFNPKQRHWSPYCRFWSAVQAADNRTQNEYTTKRQKNLKKYTQQLNQQNTTLVTLQVISPTVPRVRHTHFGNHSHRYADLLAFLSALQGPSMH